MSATVCNEFRHTYGTGDCKTVSVQKIMAAFAVSVKIDTIAYMPVQDFGNAFSTFIAQNFGAGKYDRIKDGIKKHSKVLYCSVFLSVRLCLFSQNRL